MSKKDKKKIKGTTWIKWGVLALTLSMPILELGASALYTLNRNAYQSYSGEKEPTYEDITPTELIDGNNYYLNVQTNSLLNTTNIFVSNISYVYYANIGDNNTNNIKNNCTHFKILQNGTLNSYISFRNDDDTTIVNVNIKDNNVVVNFTLDYYSGYVTDLLPFIKYRIYNDNQYLDNIIPYKKQQQLDTGILSWTPTSFTYSAINNMLVGLNVNDQYLSSLLTYWTMITAIYVVFDVVLHFFEWITHMLNKDE